PDRVRPRSALAAELVAAAGRSPAAGMERSFDAAPAPPAPADLCRRPCAQHGDEQRAADDARMGSDGRARSPAFFGHQAALGSAGRRALAGDPEGTRGQLYPAEYRPPTRTSDRAATDAAEPGDERAQVHAGRHDYRQRDRSR